VRTQSSSLSSALPVASLDGAAARLLGLLEERLRNIVREETAALAEAAPTTPAEFAAFIQSELPKYARIVRISGAKVD